MSDRLKAFYLPQSTHDAILDAGHRDPKMRPSEIIERALDFYRKMHAGGHDVAKYYEDVDTSGLIDVKNPQSSNQTTIKEGDE